MNCHHFKHRPIFKKPEWRGETITLSNITHRSEWMFCTISETSLLLHFLRKLASAIPPKMFRGWFW